MHTQELQQKLHEERAVLEKELSRLGIQDPVTGDWGASLRDETDTISDMNDMGDRDEDFATTANTLGELEIRYKDVLLALKKIEDGTYGICEVSGEPIEEDRLMANPAARTCKNHM